jgi:hypothetical protein|tara:strand:+ start:94 stop:429 length:336 start_codon:yes stop_codon:yes gene_type:complete
MTDKTFFSFFDNWNRIVDDIDGRNRYNPYEPYKPYPQRERTKSITDLVKTALKSIGEDSLDNVNATIKIRKGNKFFEVKVKDITETMARDDEEIISIDYSDNKADENERKE